MSNNKTKGNLRDQRAAIVKEAQDILAKAKAEGREYPTGDEAARLKTIGSEVADLDTKIKAFEESQALIASLTVNEPEQIPEGMKSNFGSGGSWAKTVARTIQQAGREIGVKALLQGQVSVDAAVDVYGIPDAPTTLLDAIPRVEQREGNHFSFLRQTVREDKAAVVPDDALKPTSLYTFTEVEDHCRVIAHLTEPFPLRYLEDYAGLAAILDVEMKQGIRRVLEDQIINGAGGDDFTGVLATTGVQQVAWTGSVVATLRRARTQLETGGERLNIVAMHPNDVEELDLMRENGETGGFLIDDSVYTRLVGRGVRGIASLAIPEGTALMGDINTLVLRIREGAHTIAATQAGDLFDKNQVKLRSEGRFGLQITRPHALAVVDLTA